MKSNGSHTDAPRSNNLRLAVTIRGVVQGVGFRPFVYRLATQMNLAGWVSNTAQGVLIEAEGTNESLAQFLLRLDREKPSLSSIQSLESSYLDPVGFAEFEIRESGSQGAKTTLVLPDIATCKDCLDEIFDPANRRHLYPFTNCTNCGPRFSIIESLPYDRANTSMKEFAMCPDCRREYGNPHDRRFHAQPNACPVCGPHLELWDADGKRQTSDIYAMLDAVEAIRHGKIVAVKGLGGFHLIVDAGNDDSVSSLRQRKHREEKPFALMYPSLDRLKEDCIVSDLEERLLLSPESPIVLLKRAANGVGEGFEISLTRLSAEVAPSNPYLGIMLPYTPLHHILMRELRTPVVATSGNRADEPICTDELDAVERLRGIADMFLVHNRPIVRHVDDSIVRILLDRELVLRRARGYAPLPVRMENISENSVIAVGAHLKNTVAVSNESNVFMSQHIGDLETSESFDAFRRTIDDFKGLYELSGAKIVCDLHPDYLSSKYALGLSGDVTKIQHHYAHVASCMAENHIGGPLLGISWDGTGYGLDGTVWGGEFLVTNETSFVRKASFRQFGLPGGDRAAHEPRRSALGILFEAFGEAAFSEEGISTLTSFDSGELSIVHQMLSRNLNSPRTSSVGRLFDAVASLVGLRQKVRFEGQAAMELEFLTSGTQADDAYPFEIKDAGNAQPFSTVDWEPMIRSLLADVRQSIKPSLISARFHNFLVRTVLAVAEHIGIEQVVLSGGCFQNAYLVEHCVKTLRAKGFRPYWHQRVPPNDGGIALGQVFAYSRSLGKTNKSIVTNIKAEIEI